MRPSGHTMLRRCPVPCGVPLQLSVRHSHGVAGSPAGSASDVNPLISSVRPRSATSLGTASTSSVDVATPPDTLVVQMPRVPGCSQSERTINRSTFLTELQTCCETVRAEAVQNDMRHAKAIALDSDYLEELPKLYTNEPLNLEKHVACSSRFGNGCTGPAIIRYQVQQQYTTNAILVTLQQNRAELETLKRELHLPKAVFDAGFRIVQFVTLLTTRYDAGDTSPELQEMGEMAFFHLAGHLTPATESYPPARSTLVFALRELGKTFVIGHVKHQVHLFENIVQNTLHKTENVTLFLDLFQPDLSPEYIKLYYKASELASTGCTLVRNAVMSSSKGSSVCTRRHSVRGSRFCRRLLRHGVSQMCIDGWGALSGRNISAISLIALFVIWSLRGIVNGTHCFCGTYYFPVLPCRTPWWRVCCALTPTAGFSVTLDCRQKWSL
eukprot:m.1547393 g.1547393  ORF g.1547393 m.1547393 type:complete len:440 (-) comp25260_c0_seq116:2885-4204(-)